MSSENCVDVRQVIFVNAKTRDAFDALPEAVRLPAEVAITALQNDHPLPSKRHARLGGSLSGIIEVRIPFDGDAFRVYHLVEFAEVIYVLDAGMKKSNEGSEIPLWQVRTLEVRKKAAREHYGRNIERIRRAFEVREAARRAARRR